MSEQQFFEIQLNPRNVMLRVRAPEKGKKANLSDIQAELDEKGIDYRHEHLYDIYKRASGQFEMLSTRESTEYEILVEVSAEGSTAHMTVLPPAKGSDTLTPQKIKDALAKAKVERGILAQELKRILVKKLENERVLVAQAKEVEHGEDGFVEFPKEEDTGPKITGNRVNFREMNTVKNVSEGALIATIHNPTGGTPGFTVRGKEIKARAGKKAKIKKGKGVDFGGEGGNQLIATRDGFVVISGERISVEDVMEVENVDSSTGNLRFTGVVIVKGNVEDTYEIEAEKGIEIGGTVGKCILNSEGDIQIGGGVMGAKLDAKGDISGRFFSDCDLHAGGNLVAREYLLHSKVDAGGSVHVEKSGDGFINGGQIRAGDEVISPVLGSEVSEDQTVIEVGMGMNVRKDFDQMQVELSKSLFNFEKVRKNLTFLQEQRIERGSLPEDRMATFDKMKTTGTQMREELSELIPQYFKLLDQLSEVSEGTGLVLVSNRVNAGVRIQIRRHRMAISSPLLGCAFKILNNELKVQDYAQAEKMWRMSQGKR